MKLHESFYYESHLQTWTLMPTPLKSSASTEGAEKHVRDPQTNVMNPDH